MDSTSLTASTTIVAAEPVLSTTIDGETVILHKGIEKYYGLNGVGTFVWKLLEEPRTIEEICEEVMNEYDVGYQRCKNDVEDIISEMNKKELIQFDEP